MHLLDNGTQVSSLGSPQPAVGTPGYGATGVPGGFTESILDPDIFNSIIAEIANAITGAGLTLSRTNNAQLLAAIQALVIAGGTTVNQQVFTSNGTLTVPAGVTSIVVSGCGGGAGGNTTYSGGAGQFAIKQALGVTPGHALSVAIGGGGAGGYGSSPAPGSGGNTVITDTTTSTVLLTLSGATATGSAVSTGWPNGSGAFTGGVAGGTGASGPYGGGGGAGGSSGGTGGNASGYGAGGGEGEAAYGGSGAPGLIILEW